MAQLPSGQFLMQQIASDVVLFDRYTDAVVVRYPVADRNATAQAQQRIAIDAELSGEDKAFAHFWAGYFYAHGGAS